MTQREPDGRPEEETRAKAAAEAADDTDVVLDVPVLKVEELDLEVEELRAHISARAELAGFLNIDVGVNAYVDGLKLSIKGVEAQVQLKVKLERILGSIDRALEAIDNNPDILDRDRGPRDTDRREDRAPPRELTAGPTDDGDAPQEAEEIPATPAARKKADELGMDLSGIEGTGADGRVLVRDVLAAGG